MQLVVHPSLVPILGSGPFFYPNYSGLVVLLLFLIIPLLLLLVLLLLLFFLVFSTARRGSEHQTQYGQKDCDSGSHFSPLPRCLRII